MKMALSGHATVQLPDGKCPKQCYDSLTSTPCLKSPARGRPLPKGESYVLDKSGFRRDRSLLRNQLLRERTTLTLQDAHSDPRFCGRGQVPAVELRLRKLCWRARKRIARQGAHPSATCAQRRWLYLVSGRSVSRLSLSNRKLP